MQVIALHQAIGLLQSKSVFSRACIFLFISVKDSECARDLPSARAPAAGRMWAHCAGSEETSVPAGMRRRLKTKESILQVFKLCQMNFINLYKHTGQVHMCSDVLALRTERAQSKWRRASKWRRTSVSPRRLYLLAPSMTEL